MPLYAVCSYVEASVRGPAGLQLKATADLYKSQAQSTDERLAHIDAADKQKVRFEKSPWTMLPHTSCQVALFIGHLPVDCRKVPFG